MPKGTTHVGVMATSFSGCTLKINDVIGNTHVVELSTAKNAVKVTLHESDNGESKATYTHMDVSEEEAQAARVMKEKDVPEDQKSPRALARWSAMHEGSLERWGGTWARPRPRPQRTWTPIGRRRASKTTQKNVM